MVSTPAHKSGNRFGTLNECHLSDPPDPSPNVPRKRQKQTSSVFCEFPDLPTKTIQKNPRFVHITSKDISKPLSSISVFVIQKTIDSISTQYEKISQLRDGSVLILTKDQNTAEKFIKSKAFDTICPVNTKLHANLNLSKGIAYAPCLINVPEAEIVQELKSQYIKEVYKFTKPDKDGKRKPTGLMIFTFDLFQIPTSIEIGWYKTKISEYVPNPMRCRQCQLLGHTAKWCNKPPSCENCNLPPHKDHNCTRTFCANCSGPHPASSKSCPRYVQNKEIMEIKTKQKCTLAEARRIHKDRNPINSSFSSELYSEKLKHAIPETKHQNPSTNPSTNQTTSHNKEESTSTKINLKPQNKNSTHNQKPLFTISSERKDSPKVPTIPAKFSFDQLQSQHKNTLNDNQQYPTENNLTTTESNNPNKKNPNSPKTSSPLNKTHHTMTIDEDDSC